MTMAICIKCGEEKFGAWAPCQKCGFRPIEVEDMARSILLSDHNRKVDALRSAGQQIKNAAFIFDTEEVAPVIADLQSDPALLEKIQHPERFPPNPILRVLPWAFGVAMIALLAYSIWNFIRRW